MIIAGDQRLASVPEADTGYPWRFLTKEDSTEIPRGWASLDRDGIQPITAYLCPGCHAQVRDEDAFVDHPIRCSRCRDCGFVWRRGHNEPKGENVYGDDP